MISQRGIFSLLVYTQYMIRPTSSGTSTKLFNNTITVEVVFFKLDKTINTFYLRVYRNPIGYLLYILLYFKTFDITTVKILSVFTREKLKKKKKF